VAVAYDAAGAVGAVANVTTTGAPAALRVFVKDGVGAAGLVADGSDVALVAVDVVDAAGRVVPMTADVVTFAVAGAGALIGTGNGDPTDHTPDKSASRTAYHGKVLAVVQATDDAGEITVTVSADGLVGDTLTLTSAAASGLLPRL
jgi:beta-galactosidase